MSKLLILFILFYLLIRFISRYLWIKSTIKKDLNENIIDAEFEEIE